MSKTEEALLPCPFCGGVAETIWNYTENCLETKCSNCSTYFREGNDREEAIKAWNTRHTEGQEMWAVEHELGEIVKVHSTRQGAEDHVKAWNKGMSLVAPFKVTPVLVTKKEE